MECEIDHGIFGRNIFLGSIRHGRDINGKMFLRMAKIFRDDSFREILCGVKFDWLDSTIWLIGDLIEIRQITKARMVAKICRQQYNIDHFIVWYDGAEKWVRGVKNGTLTRAGGYCLKNLRADENGHAIDLE